MWCWGSRRRIGARVQADEWQAEDPGLVLSKMRHDSPANHHTSMRQVCRVWGIERLGDRDALDWRKQSESQSESERALMET